MTDEPQFPSLDVIRAELDLRIEEQAHRAAAFDTRAGLVLGFAGVLIGLAPDDPSLVQLVAQVVAVGAAGVAVWALWFRVAGSVGPRALRQRYLTTDPETTRLRLLDTRIWLFEQDEKRFEIKVRKMRWAIGLLAGAVLLMLAGSIVDYIG